jgi:hypothetical protein
LALMHNYSRIGQRSSCVKVTERVEKTWR